MATLTAYKITESDDLGPGSNLTVKVGGKEIFLLKSEDQIALMEYVETGVQLPTSESAMKMFLKYSDDQSKEFTKLVNAYTQISEHCAKFRTEVYPESVQLASDVGAYAADAPPYYDAIVKVFEDYDANKITLEKAKKDVNDLVNSLRATVDSYISKVQKVYTAIQTFDTTTLADKALLDLTTSTYSEKFKLNESAIEEQQRAIDNLRLEIEAVKAEYTQSVIIASTTPTYAWIYPVGLIVGATVAGLYGAKAVELEKKIAALVDEVNRKTADVQLRIELKGSLSLVNENLADTSKKCAAALTALGRIKTVWSNLKGALDRLPNKLTIINQKETLVALRLAVAAAKTEWETTEVLAMNYVNTAYIQFIDTNLPKLV